MRKQQKKKNVFALDELILNLLKLKNLEIVFMCFFLIGSEIMNNGEIMVISTNANLFIHATYFTIY